MTIPVLMVVDDDPEGLGILDGTLRRRYGQDYLIISEFLRDRHVHQHDELISRRIASGQGL